MPVVATLLVGVEGTQLGGVVGVRLGEEVRVRCRDDLSRAMLQGCTCLLLMPTP